MSEQGNPAFNQALLRRFVNLMGLFPDRHDRAAQHRRGRASSQHEHPEDPFRPQVKILFDPKGERLGEPRSSSTPGSATRGARFRRRSSSPWIPIPIELDPLIGVEQVLIPNPKIPSPNVGRRCGLKYFWDLGFGIRGLGFNRGRARAHRTMSAQQSAALC